MSDKLLQEQAADLLLRYARGKILMADAVTEIVTLTKRREVLDDIELQEMLDKIKAAHDASRLKTHPHGPWAGLRLQAAIAGLVKVGKHFGRLRFVRDTYYTHCLGLPPYKVDGGTTTDMPGLRSVPDR
ncbi:hypothetical protein GCM10011609_86190 [Lentzea pudingi]|uniref:Uncharacterized protein n=1 Tax=Lentzea pudingi TaxID=1789439 RepID=A0ABQ2ISN0_9PSEU|nr:hypothetical protein [Lentzea pudingi]GGN29283.1 hypothetical protein GCM10011609_86190 [Lentzea pudingi]